MPDRKRIAILLHEKDQAPKPGRYMIWALCDFWRAQGIEINVLRGPSQHPAADLLFPHIDLTVLPDDYVALFRHYPRVINRDLLSISKRVVSRNLLSPSDTWDGPVIVKTDLNFGGHAEVRMLAGPKTWTNRLARLFSRPDNPAAPYDWAAIKNIQSANYQTFPSLDKVPPEIFANDALVVERFLPERKNGVYYLRCYVFFGDRGYCSRVGSPHPIVKGADIISRELVEIPEELHVIRRELGLDYGKMDFVLRDGRVVLFDVNRTPGTIKPKSRLQASAATLGPGLFSII